MSWRSSVKHKEVVFRKPYLTLLSTAGGCVLVVTGTLAILATDAPGRILGFLVVSVMVYGLWLLGWHSSVRIRADELVVDNLAKRYRVPWEAFAEFAVEEGLEVRLKNRSVIGSIAFGGSLIGSLLGYGHTNRVCQKMDAARLNMTKTRSGEDLPDGHRKVRTEAYFPRIPLAFVVAYFWIIATISFFVGP